ncbi:MAG: hypothetical protein V1489_02070, partial [Candidatus Liptonbacteria bacterium]
TAIEKKTSRGEKLSKEELFFLYEMDAPIEGFGYQRDSRIVELRNARNPEEDMVVLFECALKQIAHTPDQITEDTKEYVGPIVRTVFNERADREEVTPEYRNIFKKLAHIEHVYTSFPEGRIRKETIEIGGKDAKALIKELRGKKINIGGDVEYTMTESKTQKGERAFPTLEKAESEILIRLKVGDLGFPRNKYLTTDEIYQRIEELGLELCPAETGPRYRLQYANQPLNEWLWIGMKQISARGGYPSVFCLARDGDGLWLHLRWTYPGREWDPDSEFVFRLRKLKNLKT